MKKKFGLFALVLTVLLCGSLFLFAACGDGEEEEPSATPAISVTVNETARQSGAMIEGDTEDTYTIAASVVNGEEGASVTISYVYESGEAEDFSGSTFSPREAGTYVFTFTAEGASNFTLTFEIAEAQAPVVPVITASADRNEITAGGQVTLTWSATENAQVTVTYTKDGESASALQPVSGEAFTIAEAGEYVFTFAAEGAKPVTVTVTVTAAATHTHVWETEWTIKPATATEQGKASRACIASGCTDPVEVQEVTLPALNSDEAEDFYTVTVKTPATCTEKGVSTYAWVSNDDIAFDVTGDVSYEQSAHGTSLSFFDAKAATCTEAGEIAYAHCTACGKYYKVDGNTIGEEILEGEDGLTDPSRPATGHSYAVSFDTEEDYTTALGTADGQYTVDCANECGTETTIALPALTAENTWTKSEEVAATCMNPGTATFTATVSSVTVVVKGVQTAPATGHSYVVSYEGTTLSAVCEKGDSTVTATVTISGGDGATGTTEFGSDAFSFADGTFTVTLPQNAFEKEGFSFSGWLVGEETKQAGDSATVAENDTLVITAQWTEDEVPVTPVITLSVTLGGKPVEGVENGGEIYACIDTEIEYTAMVTGGGAVAITYVYESEEKKTLDSATGTFTFDKIGEYVFTLKADSAVDYTFKVNIIAHEGAYAYSAEKQVVVFTCENCGTAIDCAITGITVTGDAGSAYVVDNGDETYTAYGFTVEAVYAGVDGNPVTEIFIPLSDENLAISSVSGGYKAASVTFAYGDDVTDTTENAVYTVYEQQIANGSVSASGDRVATIGSYTGEFELRYTLSDIVRTGSDQENGWNSWVLTFDAGNGQSAIFREDNWLGLNFGRAEGQFIKAEDNVQATGASATLEGFTVTDVTFWTELNDFTNPTFVITRSYSEGIYTLTVVISEGTKAATLVLTEPTSNGNKMTVSFGSLGNATYNYSAVLGAEKGMTVSSISANPTEVEVAGGTTLEAALANVSVTVSYEEGALTDTVAATACSHEGEYDAATSDTYPITLTYGGKTTTVNVIVNAEHVHSYTNGVCSCGEVCAHTDIVENVCSTCGATWTTVDLNATVNAPENWSRYNLPDGVYLTRANSKIEITGTMDTNAADRWDTVLWEFDEGFTGRLDAYGWTYEPTSLGTGWTVEDAVIRHGDQTYTLDTSLELDTTFMGYLVELEKDSTYTFTFEWLDPAAITVSIKVVANSGTMSGAVYTVEYNLPITNSAVTQWRPHLTSEDVSSYTVASYSTYVWNS